MNKVETQSSRRQVRKNLLLLVLILSAGGLLRFCFKIGISCVDDYGYLDLVVEIWNGEYQGMGTSILRTRSAVIYPMVFFAKFFGLSEWTTLSWSFSCAVVEIAAACFIGYLLGGIRCGLLTALFLAFFPPHVILSYRMMPDIILSSFNTISIALFIFAHKVNKHQAKLFVLSGVMLGIAYLVKASALLSLLFFGLFMFCSIRSDKRIFSHGAFFFLGVCLVILVEGTIFSLTGQAFSHRWDLIQNVYTNLEHNVSAEADMCWKYFLYDHVLNAKMGFARVYLGLGLLGGLVVTSLQRDRMWLLIHLWFWMLLFYFQFGVQNFTTFESVNKEYRYLTVLYAPACLLFALTVDRIVELILNTSERFSIKNGKIFAWLFVLIIIASYAGCSVKTVEETQREWLRSDPACRSCKNASYAVKQEILKLSPATLYLPFGVNGELLAGLLKLDEHGPRKVELLLFYGESGDPFPYDEKEPFLIVLGLDLQFAGVDEEPNYVEPAWLHHPAENWKLVAATEQRECKKAVSVRIYRVTPVNRQEGPTESTE